MRATNSARHLAPEVDTAWKQPAFCEPTNTNKNRMARSEDTMCLYQVDLASDSKP